MQLKHILAVSAAALTIGLATPSLAQVTEAGNGSADDNASANNDSSAMDDDNVIVEDTANDFLDLLSNNGNGDNRDNEANDNGDNRDNEANDNGDNRDNEANDNEANDNGDNRGNTTGSNTNDDGEMNQGSNTASRGGELNQGSNVASRGGELNQGNSDNDIVATQTLLAVNTNSELDEVVDLDGEDGTETAVGYNSGSNSVNGSSFAAFAGILNNAWNTGINANTQAATNIAAQGTVSFGDSSGAADAGAPGGD